MASTKKPVKKKPLPKKPSSKKTPPKKPPPKKPVATAAPPPPAKRRLTPEQKRLRRKLAVRRFFKVLVITIIGSVLSVGVGLVVYALTKFEVEDALVLCLTPLISALIGAIYKAFQFKAHAAGVELPAMVGAPMGSQ